MVYSSVLGFRFYWRGTILTSESEILQNFTVMAKFNVELPVMDAQYSYMQHKQMQVDNGIFLAESIVSGDADAVQMCQRNADRLEKYSKQIEVKYKAAFN